MSLVVVFIDFFNGGISDSFVDPNLGTISKDTLAGGFQDAAEAAQAIKPKGQGFNPVNYGSKNIIDDKLIRFGSDLLRVRDFCTGPPGPGGAGWRLGRERGRTGSDWAALVWATIRAPTLNW